MERARISDKDRMCGHHQFKSIQSFLDHVIDLGKRQDAAGSLEEYDRIGLEQEKLLKNGCCKRCALYMSINLKSLSRDSVISTEDGQLQFNYEITHFMAGGHHEPFLILPLQYYSEGYHILIFGCDLLRIN